MGGDPHLEFRSNDQPREDFERNEFVPFRAAIQAGAEIIMTSHFGAPAITRSETLPITVSPRAIGVLHEELGFRGVVMTDRDADLTVLSVYVRSQLGQQHGDEISRALVDFVTALRNERRKVVVVSFGKLRVAELIPGIQSLMMAWSGQDVMQRAAPLALGGQSPIPGTLPLKLSARYTRGDGLVRQGTGH